MNAWTSARHQKTAPGQHTSKTLVFVSCSTTAQAWMLANAQTVLVVQLIVFRQPRNAGFRDSAKVTWFIQFKHLPNRSVYNFAKELIVVDGSRSLRKMMLEIFASFIKIAQLLMSLAHLASAVKVGVKKTFPQQLLHQQQLMIHQVKALNTVSNCNFFDLIKI